MIDSVQECVLSAQLFLATVEEEARKASGSTFMEAGAKPEPSRHRSETGNGRHAHLLAQAEFRETVLPDEIATITDKVLLQAGNTPGSSMRRGVSLAELPHLTQQKLSVSDEDMLLDEPMAPSLEAQAFEARGFKRMNMPKRHL